MDSQYKLLSELLSDRAAFITSPKACLANYWGGHCPPAPSVYGPEKIERMACNKLQLKAINYTEKESAKHNILSSLGPFTNIHDLEGSYLQHPLNYAGRNHIK